MFDLSESEIITIKYHVASVKDFTSDGERMFLNIVQEKVNGHPAFRAMTDRGTHCTRYYYYPEQVKIDMAISLGANPERDLQWAHGEEPPSISEDRNG